MRRRRGTEILARGAFLSALVGGVSAPVTAQDMPITIAPAPNNPSQVVVSTTAGGGASARIERRNLASTISWRTFHKIGWEALRANKIDEARKLFQAGIKEAERLGPNDPHLAMSYNDVAWTFFQEGRADDAEPLVRWALNTRIALLGAIHPEVGDSLILLAKVEIARKNYDEAEKAARAATTIYFHSNTGLTDRHPPFALDVLGEVAEARGELVQAHALYQRAFDIRQQALGFVLDDPYITERDLAISMRRLGGILRKQGQADQADELEQQAKIYDQQALDATMGLGAGGGLGGAGGGPDEGGMNDENVGGPFGVGGARPPGAGQFGP
jgi:tetratricopeptide (TPR) repeat protein